MYENKIEIHINGGPVELRIKRVLIFLLQLGMLWLIYQVGSIIVQYLHIPIPGNVLGMIILFISLITGVIKLEWIERAASFLLKHLVFFFIPITVGMMTLGSTFQHHGFLLFVILIGSAILGGAITGRVSQRLMNK